MPDPALYRLARFVEPIAVLAFAKTPRDAFALARCGMGYKKELCMKKLKNRIGMTLAEMLIVIAIIAVLSGIAFIAVWNHMRSLGQLERDGIAKEIFVAAQNHLTMVYGENYLKADTENYGTLDDSGVYYFVVNRGNGFTADGSSVLDQMLPFGSIDETVRAGGNYIIRYQKQTGLVLDVFYCSGNGSRYDHSFFDEDDYSGVLSKKGEGKKNERRTYVKGSILGWYGAEGAAELETLTLQPPDIEVINAGKLYVKITDKNYSQTGASLRLIVTGVKSKVPHYVTVYTSPQAATTEYIVVLDEVTAAGSKSILGGTSGGGHIASRKFDDMSNIDNDFIPGEDITIQAVAYSTSSLANVAYSTKHRVNSLFESFDETTQTAYITNIRHLENLDGRISGINPGAGTGQININAAVQGASLDWEEFKTEIKGLDSSTEINVYQKTDGDSGTKDDCYYPVSPDYAMTYDGKGYRISNIAVDFNGSAGLFGEGKTGEGNAAKLTEISNLELVDFSVKGVSSAGALAGSLNGTKVNNVLARNSEGIAAGRKIEAAAASGSAGGLVGVLNGGEINYSAASLTVAGYKAGGLIGAIQGTNPKVNGCYSGGHVEEIKDDGGDVIGVRYSSSSFDVTGTGTGALAGGLIGDAGSASITNSYSTCSVSGGTAGGFAGNAGGTITHCYSTGLVYPEKNGTVLLNNAFIGSGSPTVPAGDGNKSYYFSIVNEVLTQDGSKITSIDYKGPGNEAVAALDADADTYNSFVGPDSEWKSASAYCAALRSYYGGKYNMQTVERLEGTSWDSDTVKKNYFVRTHYGDWPAPEVFVINTK